MAESKVGPYGGPYNMTTIPELHVVHRFMLDFAVHFASNNPGARILDYGCGAGEIVQAGLASGLDISGTDVFYEGANYRETAESSGLLGTAIHEIHDGRIGFEDSYFDLVMNNQVMEHVADLDAVLREINRVLKPGGLLLSCYSSREVLREGHIGIPLSHRLPRDSKLRFYYTWTLRQLGFGKFKGDCSGRQWALDKLRWIDTYVYYRSRDEIFRTYDRYYTSELKELDLIRYLLLNPSSYFRLKCPGRGRILSLFNLPVIPFLAQTLFQRLAFMVILSRKEAR